MKDILPENLTPDKHFWYDRMIEKGFAERDEEYRTIYAKGNPSERYRKLLLAAGGPNAKLLDIGCGPGKYTEMFAVGYGEVVGLDLSRNSLLYGLRHHRASNLQFIWGDSRRLPMRDQSFDVTSTRLSIHSIAEMMRVLKPGGLAFCMRVGEYDALDIRRIFGQKGLVEKMGQYIARAEPHSRHLVEQWEDLGFKNVDSSEYEYDMHFATVVDLAKYFSRIPIIPEFDMSNPEHIEKLNIYAKQNTDPQTGAKILHRHRNIIQGHKPLLR